MPPEVLKPRLVKAKSGVFEIRWTEKTGDGYRSRALSCRTTNKRAAETVYQGFLTGERQSEKHTGLPLLKHIFSSYLSFLEDNERGETQVICIAHLMRELGDMHVSELTPEKLSAYKRARKVSDGTLRRELGTLRAAFSYAVKHKTLTALDVPAIDLPRASQPRHVYLPDDQEQAFYALAMAHTPEGARLTRLSRFVALALDTAGRKDAILSLTWDRVDLHAGTIDLREPGRQLHNKRRALVPISKRLRPVLERMHAERKTEFLLDHAGAIRAQWERWIERTPWPHITPHDLRRTWATLAVQAGVPIVNVAAILGDSVEIVMKHYAVFVSANSQAAVDARWR